MIVEGEVRAIGFVAWLCEMGKGVGTISACPCLFSESGDQLLKDGEDLENQI